jgi:hypothetical protein
LPRRAPKCDGSSERSNALAHSDEPERRWLEYLPLFKADPIIADDQGRIGTILVQAHHDPFGTGMANDVSESRLEDTKQGNPAGGLEYCTSGSMSFLQSSSTRGAIGIKVRINGRR